MEDLFAEEFNLEQMEAETEAMLALNYLDRSNSTFHRTEGGFVSLDTQESIITGFRCSEPFLLRVKICIFPYGSRTRRRRKSA